jgi:hypothetical protein
MTVGSELLPVRCLITVDDDPYFVDWPAGRAELALAFDGLDVGTHAVIATLLGPGDQELLEGPLVVTIRDPQVRPENAAMGEGIRMLASPAADPGRVVGRPRQRHGRWTCGRNGGTCR